ncbi:YfbM family protein [Pseudomonas sp. PDM22]|uniref:YfbM family protein n=1 Tax=Pseudomonas sp. PDM22 TaxID=2769287 RepID=UPI00143DB4DB|nr:YfbM family protein [Pseudomonas sp. PDM22]MBD9516442.1 YfbM family protein [Pseudomonas sp. PDM22]
MGIQAVYLSVDDAALKRLGEAPAEELLDLVEALEEADCPQVGLDKLWDGLHFLLTGVSASSPIEGNPLSEAVVGVQVFDCDDFIACTRSEELPAIVAALDTVSIDEALAAADFARFRKAKLYPKIWTDDPSQLKAELEEAFRELRDFYHVCATEQRHVLVSIY